MPQRQSDLRRRVQTTGGGDTHVKQAFKDECDVNRIMAKYRKIGLLDHVAVHKGDYGDYTNSPTSYHDAVNQVLAAEEMFLTVPSKIRAQFANDPGQFLSYVSNPENKEALIKMGLANPELPPVVETTRATPTGVEVNPVEVPSPAGPPTPPRPTAEPA